MMAMSAASTPGVFQADRPHVPIGEGMRQEINRSDPTLSRHGPAECKSVRAERNEEASQ